MTTLSSILPPVNLTTAGGTLAVANGGTGVTTSTGTTSVVLSNTPTLVTPILGAASATSIANGLGAVGTPCYTFTGDTNTGLFSPAADTVALSTNGFERMRITNGGFVGIGTTSPTGLVASRINFGDGTSVNFSAVPLGTAQGQIAGYSFRSTFIGTGDNGSRRSADISSGFASGTWGTEYLALGVGNNGATNDSSLLTSEKMRIISTGNVGIGTAAPNVKLHVEGGSVRSSVSFIVSGSGQVSTALAGAGLALSSAGSTGIAFETGIGTTSERMRITPTGNVGINESAPDYRLDVNGSIGFTPGASVTPVDNGDVVFELTNNTTLTIKAKGSDGVVRSGTVVLA